MLPSVLVGSADTKDERIELIPRFKKLENQIFRITWRLELNFIHHIVTAIELHQSNPLPPILWEKLLDDFKLPDEPVESNLQPSLATALRESLELAGLILFDCF